MVVFRAPLPGNPDYIKRLIGLPGDNLEIREGVVYINGKKLDEPYRAAPPNPTDNYGPVTVPPHEYFMMGDNRDDSYDSRYWGFVPNANIIGTPILVYMSIDAPDDAWDPGHIRDRMTAYASVLLHPASCAGAASSKCFRLFHSREHAARLLSPRQKEFTFMDYAEAGVNISLADQAKQRIRRLASRTFTRE